MNSVLQNDIIVKQTFTSMVVLLLIPKQFQEGAVSQQSYWTCGPYLTRPMKESLTEKNRETLEILYRGILFPFTGTQWYYLATFKEVRSLFLW